MKEFVRKIEELATATIGLYLMYRFIAPGNQTAATIQAMGEGFSTMMKVMIAERAVDVRDIPRVEMLLGEMNDETITELFAGLTDIDLDWIETMLAETAE